MEKEYIVTLKKGIDPISFQKDMIEQSILPYVPNRTVKVANYRPASVRNTHYKLTDVEAKELGNDSRVEAVELDPNLRDDIFIDRRTTQTGNFNKSTATAGDNINWGLRRMIALSNPYVTDGSVTGGYDHTLTGTGVDIVIQDSGIQSDHPEFQDANGTSRVQEIDWYGASGISGTMPEGFYTDYDGHGTHVASIAAGKIHGWAKGARLYSIKILPGSQDPYSAMSITDCFDVIKEWHKRKPIDTQTGVKRPTVVNMSWGYFSRYTNIAGGNYRGTSWSGSARNTSYGMTGVFDGSGYRHPIRVASVDADVEELIEAGVHVCIAAGNNYHKIDVPGGVDYDNYYTNTFFGARYYHRGSSPYSSNAIMVGNIDSQLDAQGEEQKAQSSETGPGVDLYAPGTNIFAGTSNSNRFTDGQYLNTAFRIANISGTSMASPQIAGLIATYGEVQPTSTPSQAKSWVIGNTKTQIDTNGNTDNDYTNYRSLMGGNNNYAFQEFNSPNVVTVAGEETLAIQDDDVTPTYALTTNTSSVDEGQSFTITLQTTNLVSGTIIPYTITGVESADLGGELLTGNFIVGTSMIKTFTATEDNTFDDGSETFVLTIDGTASSVSVTINDTSKPDPSYSLSATRTNLGEGESTTITLTASNVLSGTVVPYTITGITSNDIGGEPLTGNFTVGSDVARTYTFTADETLEGLETMVFSLDTQGESLNIQINDTSNSPTSYFLVSSESSVNEGQSFTITLNVENPINGVEQAYVITGVSSTDISNAPLSGTFVVGTDVQRTFTVSEDFTTEGEETFVITLVNESTVNASVTINDTSTTLVEGEEVITSPGSGTFTIPAGVTSISFLAVGGGGGAGSNAALGAGQWTGGGGAGALAWKNNLAVTAGSVVSYTVGAGGIGNNDGSATTITYNGQTYTAGGGFASPPEAITSTSEYAGKSGGAGGTATGSWTGSKDGGKGGDSTIFGGTTLTDVEAVVGGGGGGASTADIGQQGHPQTKANGFPELLSPSNRRLAPSDFALTGDQIIALSLVGDANLNNIVYNIDNVRGGGANFPTDEHASILRQKKEELFASANFADWSSEDKVYVVWKNGPSGVRFATGWDTSTNTLSLQTSLLSVDTNANISRQYIEANLPAQATSYEGISYPWALQGGSSINNGNANYSPGTPTSVDRIEFRKGVATNATDGNTTLLATVMLGDEGNSRPRVPDASGAGGGQTFVEDYRSGTGTVVGGQGGSSSLTRGLSALPGNHATERTQETISGAGTVYTGGVGGHGNIQSTFASVNVGAGAGGIMVMALAPSGSQTRSVSGQNGGLLIEYPGQLRQFNAPSYTLNSSKATVNEGSTFAITLQNNLTEANTPIPFSVENIQLADLSDTTGLTESGAYLTGGFTAGNNSKTFSIAADNTFDGIENFNLKVYRPGSTITNAATVVAESSYVKDDTTVPINDTSDGTQESFTGTVVNSGASGYQWTAGSDRNGTISGTNPNIVIDKGDTIRWTINASGHPFYIKEAQVTGTAQATNNVQNQGTTNATIIYTPSVDGRKYYQCSIHSDMHGEIYICDDHWLNLGVTGLGDYECYKIRNAGRGYTVGAYQKISGDGNPHFWEKNTDRGDVVYNRYGNNDVIPGASIVDSGENLYLAYSGSWNWKNASPGANYPSFLYITKTNAAGQNLWYRNYTDGDGYAHRSSDIQFASDGHILACGTLYNTDKTLSGMYLYKINVTNGEPLGVWKTTLTDKLTEAYYMKVHSNGDVYIYGEEITPDNVPVGKTNGEKAPRIWKFNNSLSLQWSRFYHVDQDTNEYMKPRGLALDANGNPYIGMCSDSTTFRSHVIKINASTGLRSAEWSLNNSTRSSTLPQLHDIAFDTVNSKLFCVGIIKETATGRDRGLVSSFNDALTENIVGQYRTDHEGLYDLRFKTCDIDNTSNPNIRLFVGGNGTSKYNTTAINKAVGSIPINGSKPNDDTTWDQFKYTEEGAWSVISNSVVSEITTNGVAVSQGISPSAGGNANGSVNTGSQFTQRKMALDYSQVTEPQVASPTYSLTSSASTINEGQSFTVTLDTTNVPDGTNVPYTITGVSSEDLDGVSLTGNFTIISNSASVTFNVTEDNLTD